MSFYHNRMILLLISSVIILSSCANKTTVKDAITLPRYCGNQVTVIHDDIPIFTNEEISTTKMKLVTSHSVILIAYHVVVLLLQC